MRFALLPVFLGFGCPGFFLVIRCYPTIAAILILGANSAFAQSAAQRSVTLDSGLNGLNGKRHPAASSQLFCRTDNEPRCARFFWLADIPGTFSAGSAFPHPIRRHEFEHGQRKPDGSAWNRKPVLPARKPSVPAKVEFLTLSAGVYTFALLDMHRTLAVAGPQPWYAETDPLARPLLHLPAAAYYATGLALATGVNWVSWKMMHRNRWRRLAALPQLLTIAGNSWGFKVSH